MQGVDISIAPSSTVALLGPNGAGKTTTIDMLLGLQRADGGPNLGLRPHAQPMLSRPGLVGGMLQVGSLVKGPDDAGTGQVGRRHLPEVAPAWTRPSRSPASLRSQSAETNKLSGGQASAGALRHRRIVADPELLVLDEPTVALDVEGRRDFWASMRAVAARGKTGAVRHSLPGRGRRLCRPRRAHGAGQGVADGTPD